MVVFCIIGLVISFLECKPVLKVRIWRCYSSRKVELGDVMRWGW